MSGSQRSGHGAMIRIGGPRNDRNVPMAKMDLVHQINEIVLLKPENHQGPPRTVAGTGGFGVTRKSKKGGK